MKKLLLFAAILLCANAFAQNGKVRYQGEVNVGYGIGMGNFKVDRFHIETIHGACINPHLFVGGGVGLSLYDRGLATIPVFADVKGYFTKGRIVPYAFANLGYGFGDEKGFYGAGGLGVDFSIGSMMGTHVNLGYQSQGIANNVDKNGLYGPSNMGAFLLQAGFRF